MEGIWRPGPRWLLIERILSVFAAVISAYALYAARITSPPDAKMGEKIRYLYLHVGAAEVAYLAGFITALGAVLYLKNQSPHWDWLAESAAEWGLLLTAITLATGMVWGKETWGKAWDWSDPRLVITLFMAFLYLAYLFSRRFLAEDPDRAAKVSAVLAITAVPVMILNHFALLIFRQVVHPAPVVIRPKPALGPEILETLLYSLLAYTLVFVWILMVRIRLSAMRAARRMAQ